MKGLDISKWQGNLSMQSVKNAGYDFVIIRGAYTSNGQNRVKNVDPKFEDFYADAKSVGLLVGVYYYSCATNTDEGRSEAEFLFENCLKGKQFEMPIYIDVEDCNWQKGNVQGVTDAVIGFVDYLQSIDFYAGVYASKNWFATQLDYTRLEEIEKWVACWSDSKPDMPFYYTMWQNSSSGNVDGVRVDTDIAYEDFFSIIKYEGLNGYGGNTPEPTPQPTRQPTPEPEPSTNYKIGDSVTFSKIFVSSSSTEALEPFFNGGVITRIISGARNPYLINDGMGWVNDSVINGSAPANDDDINIEVGDSIMIHDGAKDMNTGGTYASYVYNTVYKVIQVKGNRVVFGLDGVVTGATLINNCIKV